MNPSKQTSLICGIHATGALTALCLVLACWKGVLEPLDRQAETDQARIAQIEKLLGTPEQWQEENRRLTKQSADLAAAVEFTRQNTAGAPRDDLFMQEAESLAAAAGLQVVDWNLGADSTQNEYLESRLEGQFNGSFASICQFLASLNQIPRVAKITALRIKSTQNSDGYPVTISFALYYSSEQHDTEREETQL